jgi:hypothetical protein
MSGPPAPGGYFHVGIVVPFVEAAAARLTEVLGVTWGPLLEVDSYEVSDGTDRVVPMTMRYSVEEPRLELIQEIPGTVWACNEHSNLHHIGIWTGDVRAASAGLASAACPMQACGRAGSDAPVTFAYHGNELGVRIEVLDDGMRSVMESFLFLPPS